MAANCAVPIVLAVLLCTAAGSHARGLVQRAKVGVLGAGMAGISAAATLEDLGISDFLVLEADNEMGGRIKSGKLGNLTIEYGANWVHGKDGNPLYALALACGLKMADTNDSSEVAYDEEGKRIAEGVYAEVTARYETALDCVIKDFGFYAKPLTPMNPDTDFRTALRICGWEPQTPLEWAVDWNLANGDFGWFPDQMSVRNLFPIPTYLDYEAIDNLVIDQRGYAEIVRCLADRKLKKGGRMDSRIIYNANISSIVPANTKGNGPITVMTASGDKYVFDHVIVTFSQGVLWYNLDRLFPTKGLWSLPKRVALTQHRMGVYHKLFMQFPHQFWDKNTTFIVQASDEEPGKVPLWMSLDIPEWLPGSNILLGAVADEHARGYELLDDSEMTALLMERLKAMYGNDIPEPTDVYYARWFANPLTRGGYTNWDPRESVEEWRLAFEPLGDIYFAGEATCRRMVGYVHGALGSGERTVKHLLQDKMNRTGLNPDGNFCERQITQLGESYG